MTEPDFVIRTFAPVMNQLLQSEPFVVNGLNDGGWFCREHALVTKLLLGHFGIQCDIVCGEVTVYVSGEKRFTTIGAGADHAWCTVGELIPCDLSMTFRYRSGYPDLDAPIIGQQGNGIYSIVYGVMERDLPVVLGDGANAIYFTPKNILSHTCHDIISNPLLVVKSIEAGTISLAIAGYLGSIPTRNAKPLFDEDTPQPEALTLVLKYFAHQQKQLHGSIPDML